MALYRITDGGVRQTVTNVDIPDSPDNTDWKEYLDWVSGGNTPDAKLPEPVLTIDEEYDQLSDWLKELVKDSGSSVQVFKSKIAARRVKP